MNDYEKYLRKVKAHLHLDSKTKKRVIEGLRTEIEYATENGETIQEVLNRMGKPEKMALSYNESYKNDYSYQKKRKYSIAKNISIISLLIMIALLLISVFIGIQIGGNYSISYFGGVSNPISVEITNNPITIMDLIKYLACYIAIPFLMFVISTIYCVTLNLKDKNKS